MKLYIVIIGIIILTGKSFSMNDSTQAFAQNQNYQLIDTLRNMQSDYTIQDSIKAENFWVLGGALGSPAGASLIGGLYLSTMAFRISGGYWNKGWYGLQGDWAFIRFGKTAFVQDLALVAGMFGTRGYEQTDNGRNLQLLSEKYIGLVYDCYYTSFFLQFGLGFGKGDIGNPQLLFQFGYLFNTK